MEIKVDLSKNYDYVVCSEGYKDYIFRGTSEIPEIGCFTLAIRVCESIMNSSANLQSTHCKGYPEGFVFKLRETTNKHLVYIFFKEKITEDRSIVETLRFLLPKNEIFSKDNAPVLIYQRFLTIL